ncbi:MAG: hypothetical protein Q9166_006401 [cf. Caloplaca sp. 2 TL-2023]
MMQAVVTTRGANVPVIGHPRLISSSLGPAFGDDPGRPRNYETRDASNSANHVTTDPETEQQRMIEIFRRIRVLCDDSRVRHLSARAWADRIQFLDCYRTAGFLRDLAEGHHDDFTQALDNQEHDSYYSDLWARMSRSSRSAALALRSRIQPHKPPEIALTIPPKYEPSDLPSYTATELPPTYSADIPEGHATRDVPLCDARDCPIRLLGMEHSLGLYHHKGQVGPSTASGGDWLPSFGRSNPPPHVWDAYKRLVLDVETEYQRRTVKAFVRYHGRPWTPQEQQLPAKEKNHRSRSKSVPATINDRWAEDRSRRIPRYTYEIPDTPDIPNTETKIRGLEENGRYFETELASVLNAQYLPQETPTEASDGLHGEHVAGRRQHQTAPNEAGHAIRHRHGTVHVHTPHFHHRAVQHPAIAEMVDQTLVPAPLFAFRMNTVNHGVTDEHRAYRRRLVRFADEVQAEANEGTTF